MKLNLVPARTGIQWVKLGIKTFSRQPIALAGLFFVYMAMAALLSMLPVLGPILMLVITPAATLGLLVATQEAVDGKFPLPTVLVAALRAGRQRLRSMLQLGLIYATGSMLIVAFVTLTMGRPQQAAAIDVQGLPDATMLVLLALHMPLAIAFWFAPALVHWHGVSPVKSLFFSTVAVLRNFGAFVVFGLAWAGVTAAIAIVVSTLVLVFGRQELAPAFMTPAVLVLAAMFFTSIYFTFLDCFTPDAPADPSSIPTPTQEPTANDPP